MRNLLANKKVQIGLGVAGAALVVWLCVAGGSSDQVEEATTTGAPAEVVAPENVETVINSFETTGNAAEDKETNTSDEKNATK
jgi:hypothetical protein